MADVRDWRRRGDWGRPYEDDPYWNWRGEDRDWRRESRDVYGDDRDPDWSSRREWPRVGHGGADWGRSEARGRDYGERREGEWRRREGTRYGDRWDQGFGPRDPGRDPDMAARRAIGGRTPGGPWPLEESWSAGEPGWRRGYQPGGYWGRPRYEREPYYYEGDYYRSDRRPERSWWDRASDEVSSWFGDEDAERRRQRDYSPQGYFRGHGPRGYTRSDERIREDVSDRLTDNPILDATEVEVAVSSGEVTLHGHVDSRYAKRLAEDLADEVSGVKHVQNNLRIRDRRPEAISATHVSDVGRTEHSGVSGSTGTGNTAGRMTTSMAASGETATGAKADRTTTERR